MEYVINFDEYKSIGIHWIALYVNGNNAIYFNSFGVEHISKEIKKFKEFRTLNYIEHVILASTITGCISISAFTSWLGIPIRITGSAIGLKICAIAAGIEKYKSIIKKKKKKHNKIVKLNNMEALTSRALIDSNERINKKFKVLKSSSKILVYL